MKNLMLIVTAVSLIFLVGCQKSGNKDNTTKVEISPKNEALVLTTADLKAPEGMKFISHEKINILADITNQGGGPAYLSVYSDYEHIPLETTSKNNHLQWKTNQNSRVLASSIEHNIMEQQLAIPQHLTRLLLQVWFYDGRPAVSQEITIKEQVSVRF